jgi:guanine deaminase
MAGPVKKTVYQGTFIHSKSLKELQILHDTAAFVDEKGKIVAIAGGAIDKQLSELGWSPEEVEVKSCEKEQFFFPGFIGKGSRPLC